MTAVRMASKRCFGFKLSVLYYELAKTIRLKQKETDTVIYINWGTDLKCLLHNFPQTHQVVF